MKWFLAFLFVMGNSHFTYATTTKCKPFFGVIDSVFVKKDCKSIFHLCTQGVIRTKKHVWSMRFSADGLGGAPVKEKSIVTPPIEPSSTWTYAGKVVLKTKHHYELVLQDIGVFDSVEGSFSSIMRIRGGKGKYKNAQGVLWSHGISKPQQKGFNGIVQGKICISQKNFKKLK